MGHLRGTMRAVTYRGWGGWEGGSWTSPPPPRLKRREMSPAFYLGQNLVQNLQKVCVVAFDTRRITVKVLELKTFHLRIKKQK